MVYQLFRKLPVVIQKLLGIFLLYLIMVLVTWCLAVFLLEPKKYDFYPSEDVSGYLDVVKVGGKFPTTKLSIGLQKLNCNFGFFDVTEERDCPDLSMYKNEAATARMVSFKSGQKLAVEITVKGNVIKIFDVDRRISEWLTFIFYSVAIMILLLALPIFMLLFIYKKDGSINK